MASARSAESPAENDAHAPKRVRASEAGGFRESGFRENELRENGLRENELRENGLRENELRENGLRAKAARVEGALTEAYGARVWRAENYQDDILGALVATVLSQNTSDLNSGRAYASLRLAFPGGWEDVRTASVTAVADAIRAGGLANIKAPRIQAILQDVYERNGRTDLDHIRLWDDAAIRDYLRSFHGVGAKTAACVLMFNLGRPVLPVDTHVHRVSRRLGLIGPTVTADQAHDLLPRLLDDDRIYSFHVHLIEHGRRTCHSQKPACAACPVQRECDFYNNRLWADVSGRPHDPKPRRGGPSEETRPS